MYYTPKIKKAISFADAVHQGQSRKGSDTPYITHSLTVGLTLAGVNSREDVICAGILHDTIEDCKPYGSITRETLIKEFGADVACIVNDVSEKDKSLSWVERKETALNRIPQMEQDSLLVKSADVLDNLFDQIADYKDKGDAMFANFNAPRSEQLARYMKLVEALQQAWSKNPI